MKFERLFYEISWFRIVREILFGNGRCGKVREILGPGMDGTGNFPHRGNTNDYQKIFYTFNFEFPIIIVPNMTKIFVILNKIRNMKSRR
jgi:hypothetical protein